MPSAGKTPGGGGKWCLVGAGQASAGGQLRLCSGRAIERHRRRRVARARRRRVVFRHGGRVGPGGIRRFARARAARDWRLPAVRDALQRFTRRPLDTAPLPQRREGRA
jgi:hypothetical protein